MDKVVTSLLVLQLGVIILMVYYISKMILNLTEIVVGQKKSTYVTKDTIDQLISAERALLFYAQDSSWMTTDGVKERDTFLYPEKRCLAEKDWGTLAQKHFEKYPQGIDV